MNNQQIDNIFKDAQHELEKMPREEVWHKLNNLLDEDNSTNTAVEKKTPFKWWYAVAGLLLFLAPSLLFLNYFNGKTNIEKGSIAQNEVTSKTSQTRSAAAKSTTIDDKAAKLNDFMMADSEPDAAIEEEELISEEAVLENIAGNYMANEAMPKREIPKYATNVPVNNKPSDSKPDKDIAIKNAGYKLTDPAGAGFVITPQKVNSNLAEDKATSIANTVAKKTYPTKSEEFIITKNEEGSYEAIGDSNSKIKVTLNNNMEGAIAVEASENAESEALDFNLNEITAKSAGSSNTKLKKGKVNQTMQNSGEAKGKKALAVPALLLSLNGLWKNKTASQKNVLIDEVTEMGEMLSKHPFIIQKDAVQFEIFSIDIKHLPIRLTGKSTSNEIITFSLTEATKKQLIFQAADEKAKFNKVLIHKLSKKKIEVALEGLQGGFSNTFIRL